MNKVSRRAVARGLRITPQGYRILEQIACGSYKYSPTARPIPNSKGKRRKH